MQSAWNSLEPLTNRKKLKLECWGASALSIEADESKIYRLLLNLLDNSIKHSPPQQIISIRVDLEKSQTPKNSSIDSVIIEIIDSGSGFALTALPHVFDRFYQSHQPEVNLRGGTGLGLAIVRQIVEAHNGTITIDNHPETGGAWIKVVLPATQIQKS
jgi:two-component system phosphate regulon sensor histidine kinase PhoR